MKKNIQPSPDQDDFFSFDDLPDRWTIKKLGEIVSPSKKKIEPTAGSTIPYIGLEHIESNSSKIIGHGISGDAKSTKTVFHAGDVLYGKLRPYLNKVTIPDFDGVCSTDILVFNQNQIIDSRYLMRYLSIGDVVKYANLKSKGISLPRVSFESLMEIPVPLPPLAEQQRIVARVEALVTHVNAARERMSRVPLIMKKFRQAVLAAACSGRLTEGWRESNAVVGIEQSLQKDEVDFNDETNTPFYIGSIPETWGWISIDDAMEKVIDYRGRTPPIENEGIPHITTSNIRNGHINWITEKFVTQETYDNYMTRGIPAIGDVFFTMEGPLGEVAILHENRKFSLAQRMLLLRGQKEIFDSEYLAFALMCSGVQSAINMKATGSGVKGIAYKRFKHVKIPLPPLAEQCEIVRRVGLLFERADAFDQEVAAASRRCERLTQAVLGKAFRGELTTHDSKAN